MRQDDPVLLVCVLSTATRKCVTILRAASWIEEIEIADPHDFAACYRAVAERLPRIVRAREVSQRELVVDVSNAPQPLACAVTMAAAPFTTTIRFETNDDWPGAGDANPWEALAYARVQGAVEAFDLCRWDVAVERFEQLACLASLDRTPLFAAIEAAVRAFRAWDRVRYSGVGAQFAEAAAQLVRWQPPRRRRALVDVVDALRDCSRRAEKLETGDKRALAADQVANADRRARIEGRFDDAVLRLSSAVVLASADLTLRTMPRPRDAAEEYEQIRAHVMRGLRLTEADVFVFPRFAELDVLSLV